MELEERESDNEEKRDRKWGGEGERNIRRATEGKIQ